MRARQLALMGVLAAAALGIYALEAQLPPIVPIAGVKLGLANIITLVTMAILGRRQALAVLAVRIVLGSFLAGSVSGLLFSAAGGILAYGAMAAAIAAFPARQLWVVSVLGAIAHNLGQLLAALAVTQTLGVLWYGLPLLAAAIVTGAFTGLAAQYLVRALRRLQK